ncbi:MAG: hypothetical protein J6T65_05000 [Clostridia bacterium]|nr:hypothetical protein [Clostridia bacterium]
MKSFSSLNFSTHSRARTGILRAAVFAAVLCVFASSFTFSGSKSRAASNKISGPKPTRVIYEENFDGVADGKLPEGWTTPVTNSSFSAGVKDGRLVITSTNVELGKVLLPDSLNSYGNYIVEADVTFESVRNGDKARWMSIVVRQQPEDERYYHMCVRCNTTASNGVEFAARNPGSWTVYTTASAKKQIGFSNTAHLKMAVYGDTVFEYVNDELIIATDAISSNRAAFKTGGIGFQANFSVITVDNVTVSECEYTPDDASGDKSYMAYNLLDTPVISSAATIAEPVTAAEIDAFAAMEKCPDNIILHVNGSGKVTSPDGAAEFGTLEEVYSKIARVMVPVFYVKDQAAGDALCSFLKSNKIYDCLLLSDDPDLMVTLRKSQKRSGGVLDYSSLDEKNASSETLDRIISEANAHSAKTVIVSEDLANKAGIEYMQHRLITVWVRETASPSDDAMLHNSIQSGANGIVTDTPEKLIAAYAFYSSETAVLVRNPLVIGHRGLPSVAPENSLESAREAVSAGIDCIELDVYLSSDGEVFIYHDGDLSSMTTGSGPIGSHTAAELKSYDLLRSSGYGTFKKYPKVKIPTLREFFEEFRNDDVMFFIEIKEDTEIYSKVADLVNEYNMNNRCCMITFNSSQISKFKTVMPGMSEGQLMSSPTDFVVETRISKTIQQISNLNATFNASGVYGDRFIRGLMYRGVTAWPWTYGSSNTADAYLLGVGGITTDTGNLLSNVPTRIEIGGKYEYTLNPTGSGTSSVEFFPTVYDRLGIHKTDGLFDDGTEVPDPEFVIIDGAEHISVYGNKITAVSDGTAHLMCRLVTSVTPGSAPTPATEFTLYSQVITINVDSSADKESDLPKPPVEKTAFFSNPGSVVAASVAVAFIIAAVGVMIGMTVKKRKNT